MVDYSNTYYHHKIVPLDNFRRIKYNQYISLYKESVQPPIVIEGNNQQQIFHTHVPMQYGYKYSQNPQVALSMDYSRKFI